MNRRRGKSDPITRTWPRTLLIAGEPRLTVGASDAQVVAMTLHLVKLCVGCESVDDLMSWIAERKADRIRRGVSTDRIHRTRQSPKRAADLLDGGSLYWVIKGEIKVRETILELRAVTDDAGISHCDIVLTGELVPVEPRRLRPFQGWRYLAAHEAPRDLASFGSGMRSLPPELARELSVLGLL